MGLELALLAWAIDRTVGELPVVHPVALFGRCALWVEKWIYRDSFFSGALYWVVLVGLAAFAGWGVEWAISSLPWMWGWVTGALVCSMLLAHTMLRKCVREVEESQGIALKRERLALLVSRECEELDETGVTKAAIETYAENFSDGFFAPMFWLILFGPVGLFVYKAINTLDSMVGYKTVRYNRFGCVSARLDDLANLIPARLSAGLILFSGRPSRRWSSLMSCASGHESPNAGWPICAMGLALHVRLGGPARYFGQWKEKPVFGEGGREPHAEAISSALEVGRKAEGAFLLLLVLFLFCRYQFL